LIYIDSSKKQDELIMDYQRARSAGDGSEATQEQTRELLKNAQRLLQPVKVINPFAKQLKLPQSVFKPRRTNAHYLHFIEAVTFLHQSQREQKVEKDTGVEFIETTLEDIENANKLLKDILLRKSDKLSPACRSYFEQLKLYLERENQTEFKNNDIRQALEVSHSKQKRYMSELLNDFYIQIKSGNRKTGFTYAITSFKEYSDLKSSINSVLDDALNQLRPMQKTCPEKIRKKKASSLKEVC
jgi:hypothetical protein